MTPHQPDPTQRPSRRGFLELMGGGLYGAALSTLLGRDLGARTPGADDHAQPSGFGPRQPHFAPRARSVIQLFMNGGPSQMDLFDPKPELDRNHGKSYFDQIAGEVENPLQAGKLMRCPYRFAQHGESGMWVSEVMPHLATQVDRIAFIRSMHTTNITHEPALYKIHSGRMLPGLPSMGSWITWGLGSESQNLPAYVVLDDPLGLPINGHQSWQAGFLPPQYQGTRFRTRGEPVLDLQPDYEEPAGATRVERALLSELDRLHLERRPGQPELEARIESYGLAARMQLGASEALDLSRESEATRALYGVGEELTDSYGKRCLIARRLVERGVRFVQIFIHAQVFDHHTQLESGLRGACVRTDKPIAGLLADLAARGLLDETLVLWGGEFGRLPISQLPDDGDESLAGRDHNKNAFCTWMAGGGVRGGVAHGATDELGLAAVEDRVSVPDWHATILHLLGLDSERLHFERLGLEEKLTATFPSRVVSEILA